LLPFGFKEHYTWTCVIHEKIKFVRLKKIEHLFLWVYVGYFSTCLCEHIKFASMEDETENLQDDYTLLENHDQINRKSTDLCWLGHCNDQFHWFCNFL